MINFIEQFYSNQAKVQTDLIGLAEKICLDYIKTAKSLGVPKEEIKSIVNKEWDKFTEVILEKT